jgi:nicotinamide mononucleotide transporter
MLARKYLENWFVWILADGLAVGLFIYKELYPTSVLFVVYTVMSVAGYLQWSKSVEK